MIKELDVIALTRPLPDLNLVAGDIGTIVMVHDGGYSVEFMTLTGETIGVATLQAGDVRTVHDDEIAHARAVA